MIAPVSRRSSADSGAQLVPLEEAELIRRCRAGERAAQEAFYHRFRRSVAANLYRVLNDRTDLDDLVQEVFVIAYRGLARFRGEARLSTWIYRICINVALGRIRSRSRRPLPTPLADPEAATGADLDSPEPPDRLLEREQDRARVHAILEALPPKKRIVFYLHEIEGLDLRDIAYVVDSNPVTVRTRLFYARKEFYRRLAEEGGEQGAAGADLSGKPDKRGDAGEEEP
jgi:RNA polymerase sigma-70 factor (ECF subfamily)